MPKHPARAAWTFDAQERRDLLRGLPARQITLDDLSRLGARLFGAHPADAGKSTVNRARWGVAIRHTLMQHGLLMRDGIGMSDRKRPVFTYRKTGRSER